MKIIALSGKRQRGKDTAALILNEFIQNSRIVRWADCLKTISAIILGCKKEDFEKEDFKNSKIGGVYGSMTYREFLLKLGTECGRLVNESIWIDALARGYKEGETIIVPDTRFLNEAEFVTKNGGLLIRINRKDVDESGVSDYVLKGKPECELDDYPFKYVIQNNGTIEDLEGALLDAYVDWYSEHHFLNSPGLN
jgi:hypothetical protein